MVFVTAVSKTQRFWATYHTESSLTGLMGDQRSEIREAQTLQLWNFFTTTGTLIGEPLNQQMAAISCLAIVLQCCYCVAVITAKHYFLKSHKVKGLIRIFRKDILDIEFLETCFPVTSRKKHREINTTSTCKPWSLFFRWRHKLWRHDNIFRKRDRKKTRNCQA